MPEESSSKFSNFLLTLSNKIRSSAAGITQPAQSKVQEGTKPLNADHAAVERIMGPPKNAREKET
ncbi:uncharacterized protein RHO25_000302 [Cercospora beticola]|uniref:Uncharacterized protein n=1 Tax=Cercospora beticola TaxID=122368 RepID=A0ABZ0N860_CERBT|nr:hypothetical protein RHO25_000302 [Cercospora beticola]CAK1356055.1 unnamed protein product [Cercospora beticola]